MILLGVKDLTKRWNYTRQGVHQKQKQDDNFPKPVAIINEGRTKVFLEKDIIEYENNHKRELRKNVRKCGIRLYRIYYKPCGGCFS
jgi:hypothetical protein